MWSCVRTTRAKCFRAVLIHSSKPFLCGLRWHTSCLVVQCLLSSTGIPVCAVLWWEFPWHVWGLLYECCPFQGLLQYPRLLSASLSSLLSSAGSGQHGRFNDNIFSGLQLRIVLHLRHHLFTGVLYNLTAGWLQRSKLNLFGVGPIACLIPSYIPFTLP